MKTLSDQLADSFHEDAMSLYSYESQLQKERLYYLNLLIEDIRTELIKNDITEFSGKKQDKKKKELLLLLSGLIESFYTGLELSLKVSLDEAIPVFYDRTVESINNVFNGKLLQKSSTKDSFKFDELLVGAALSDWVDRQRVDLINRISDQINLSILANEDLKTMLDRIVGIKNTTNYSAIDPDGQTVGVPSRTGGVFNTSLNQQNTLIKTASGVMANTAKSLVYSDNDGLIQGVQALVTLDNRTSALCRGRSGFQWLLDGTPIPPTDIFFPGTPPWHPNCRTILIPVFFDKELLKGLVPDQKLLINNFASSGNFSDKISDGITYEGWLKEQPEIVQKRILGDTKYRLWKSGNLTLNDMVNQNGNPLTLDELKL